MTNPDGTFVENKFLEDVLSTQSLKNVSQTASELLYLLNMVGVDKYVNESVQQSSAAALNQENSNSTTEGASQPSAVRKRKGKDGHGKSNQEHKLAPLFESIRYEECEDEIDEDDPANPYPGINSVYHTDLWICQIADCMAETALQADIGLPLGEPFFKNGQIFEWKEAIDVRKACMNKHEI